MSFIPIKWTRQYVVAVTKGRRTRYFYGTKLKDAMNAARLKSGDGFAYACFTRGPVKWGEKTEGDCYKEFGPMRKAKAA